MALIAQSDLEARLGRSLTSAEASAFTLKNAANQAYVERYLGSSVESVDESTRYYDGGLQHIPIDPCTNVSSIKIADDDLIVTDTLDTTDYILEPQNRELKYMIRWRAGKLIRGINNVQVTAKFSIFEDTDALNIVKNVLLDMLLGSIPETDNQNNIVRESIEGYAVEYGSSSVSTVNVSSWDLLETLVAPVVL